MKVIRRKSEHTTAWYPDDAPLDKTRTVAWVGPADGAWCAYVGPVAIPGHDRESAEASAEEALIAGGHTMHGDIVESGSVQRRRSPFLVPVLGIILSAVIAISAVALMVQM
jgi:hypothetical protein